MKKKTKYGIQLHTDYKLSKDEYTYIAIMTAVSVLAIGLGLCIGGCIVLTL